MAFRIPALRSSARTLQRVRDTHRDQARPSHTVIADAASAERRAPLPAPEPRFERGYGWMFSRHIRQAHEGCDFDFLETGFGASPGEPAIL